MRKMFLLLAFLLCIAAGAKAQTGEIGLELMWEKTVYDTELVHEYVVFSNDGVFLYTYSNWDSTLFKIDANTGDLIHRYDNSKIIGDRRFILTDMEMLRLTPDERYAVTISSGGTAIFWDLEADTIRDVRFNGYPTNDFEISPDSRYLYVGRNVWESGHNASYSEILIYDIDLDEVVGKIDGLEENQILEIRQMELSGSGDSLFIYSQPFFLENDDRTERRFALINTRTKAVEKIIDTSPQGIALKISDSGNLITISRNLGLTKIFNISNVFEEIFSYQSGISLLINDSTWALYFKYIDEVRVDRIELWQNKEFINYVDDYFLSDWDSYEDESGFKVCVANGFRLAMYSGVITLIEDDPELGIAIYPNPARDKLNIKLDETSRVNSIAIYDVIGREINSYQPNNRELKISNLPKGVYLLKIGTESGIISEKVVVE